MKKPNRRRTKKTATMPAVMQDALTTMTDDAIARRAYGLYEERGREHGHDLDDWLRAERELREAFARSSLEQRAFLTR